MAAKSLAKHFFCLDNSACGNCHNCVLFEAGTLPDLLEIDSDSTNTEEFKEILKTLYSKSISAAGRIIIIDNFELLNNSIYNLLLKTLEEPPANNHFLLVTSSIGKLPFTIQSRSQIVHFNNLPQIELANFIADNHLEHVSRFKEYVDGAPGKLVWISKNLDLANKILNALESNSTKNLLSLSEILVEEKDHLRECLEIIVAYAKRQLIHSKNIENLTSLFSNQEAVLTGYLSRNINLKLLTNIFISQLATLLKGNYILEQDLIHNWIN